jgi:hypothetical protein
MAILQSATTHKVVTDQRFGLAELLLFGLSQMTELFTAEHRTFFFVLQSMPMASFHSFVLLNDPNVHSVIIGL